MYVLDGKGIKIEICEVSATFKITVGEHIWTMNGRPYVALTSPFSVR